MRETHQYLQYEIVSESSSVSLKITNNTVGHDHIVDSIEFTNLDPRVSYELLIKNNNGRVIDSRNFQAINQNAENPKVAVCSCSRLGLLSRDDKTLPMWDRVMAQNPDVILFLGDIVYGDNAIQAVMKFLWGYHPSFSQIQKRFIQSWKKERLYHQQKLVPVFSIWDDHDFGFEASDKTNPFKRIMLKLFRSYFPIPNENKKIAHGPGLSYSFYIYGRKLLMLDNRSFFNAKEKSLLGLKQIKWIEEQIKGEKEVIMGSGMSLVDTKTIQESVQRDAPREWSVFKQIFIKYPVKAVFLTGDAHFSEVRAIPADVLGFKTFQIISSPLKSTSPRITPPFKSGKLKFDKNQLLHIGGYNFAMLKINSLFKELEITFHPKNKPAIELISSFEALECKNFYKVAN